MSDTKKYYFVAGPRRVVNGKNVVSVARFDVPVPCYSDLAKVGEFKFIPETRVEETSDLYSTDFEDQFDAFCIRHCDEIDVSEFYQWSCGSWMCMVYGDHSTHDGMETPEWAFVPSFPQVVYL